MTIPRIVLVGAVCSIAALSGILSGCATTAQSQPLEANSAVATTVTDPWRAKVGQKCTLWFSTTTGESTQISGVLKSATDKWIIISDVDGAEKVNDKVVFTSDEYHIPIASILYLTFPKPKKVS